MRRMLHWLWLELLDTPRTRHEPCIRHSDYIGGEGSYRHGAAISSPITGIQFYELWRRFNSLSKELFGDLFRQLIFEEFKLHEIYLDDEESMKGDSLADKLPPMDEQDTPHLFTDSFHGFISRGAVAQQRLCHLA